MLNGIEIWRIRWPLNNLNLVVSKKPFNHSRFMNKLVILLDKVSYRQKERRQMSKTLLYIAVFTIFILHKLIKK